MNRSKLSLRRPLAVLGAAVLGAAAALALASPASAHWSEPSGSAVCDTTTGEWVVTWSVASKKHFDSTHFKLTYVALQPEGTTVTNIAVTEGSTYPHDVNVPLVGEQRVPGTATQAKLAVKAKWNDGYKETGEPRKAKVKFDEKCEKDGPPPTTPPPADVTKPDATFQSVCDGTVKVTLINGDDANAPVELTVKAKDFEKTFTLKPGESKDDIFVPAGAGPITVTEKGKDKPVKEPFTWIQPENCGEPALAVASTCDELIFEVTNPKDGSPITVTFTPSTGEPQTVDVAPGAVETVTFPGTEGLTVTPSAGGDEGEPIAWEPEECGPPPSGGGGGDLPQTGVPAGAIAGGAAILLAIGGILFFLARRRRVTFTA